MAPGLFLWTSRTPPADPAFIDLAKRWVGAAEADLVNHVWAGFERLKAQAAIFDGRDLERSITQLLSAAIDDLVPGEAPYYVQHGPYERETMLAPPAQPPAYDLAFVLRADPRVMWPAEAKVLTSANALADYLADVGEQFLSCRYAPFSSSGAMLGYLLSGEAEEALENIGMRLGVAFAERTPISQDRPHRSTVHDRKVPTGKSYPTQFRCHHLMMSFHGLERHRRGN
ncbi:MAG: hypothetical protein ABWX67_09780 [Allosphingosinicella sp.]